MRKRIYKTLDGASFKGAVMCTTIAILGWSTGVGMMADGMVTNDNIINWIPFFIICTVSALTGFFVKIGTGKV